MVTKRALAVLCLALGMAWLGAAMEPVHGSFDFTLKLLPAPPEVYKAVLELSTSFAGWEVTSESKFYSDGWKYQNFYIDGGIGDVDIWGKVFFHARDVRYQKFWLNAEMPLSGEGNYLRLSVDHWASPDDYFSGDVKMFGPWPCAVWWEELLPWSDKQDLYEDKTFCVQGPVVSYWPPSPSSWVTFYVGAPYDQPHFAVFFTGDAFDAMVDKYGPNFWEDLVGKTICACGEITEYRGNPEIAYYDAEDIEDFKAEPCDCMIVGTGGPLMIYRAKLVLAPITLTVDFADCCSGIQFKKLDFSLTDMAGCCGFLWDAGLSFTKCHGFERFYVDLKGLPFPCCGIGFDVSIDFTTDGKTVSVKPTWEGLATGCVEVYGDVDWSDHTLSGFALYGFSVKCYFDDITLRSVTAFDPDKVADMTDISFYSGEFEYLGLEYQGSGCCGGDLTFTSEIWFGDHGLLFGVQRAKFDLEFPLYEGFTVVVKGQWDFSQTSPLDWFDVGFKVEF